MPMIDGFSKAPTHELHLAEGRRDLDQVPRPASALPNSATAANVLPDARMRHGIEFIALWRVMRGRIRHARPGTKDRYWPPRAIHPVSA